MKSTERDNPNSLVTPRCVFWDPTLDSGYGDWSTEGCERAIEDDNVNFIGCKCSHLSTFTIVLVCWRVVGMKGLELGWLGADYL